MSLLHKDKLAVLKTGSFSGQISCSVSCKHFINVSHWKKKVLSLANKSATWLLVWNEQGTIIGSCSEEILLWLNPFTKLPLSCYQNTDTVSYFALYFKL